MKSWRTPHPPWSVLASGSTGVHEMHDPEPCQLPCPSGQWRIFIGLILTHCTELLQLSPSNPWHMSLSPGSDLPWSSPMLGTSPAIRLQQKNATSSRNWIFIWLLFLLLGDFYVFREIRLNQKTRFHSCQLTFLSELSFQKPSKLRSSQKFSQAYFTAKKTGNISSIASL